MLKEPYLSYLTVFRSRLGLLNLVLDVIPIGHQTDRTLRRRVKQAIEKRVETEIADPANASVFQYLVDKRIAGSSMRASGRYRGVSLVRSDDGGWVASTVSGGQVRVLPVYQMDIWFSDPLMASTIGVPTPDNSDEVCEFAFQFGILDHDKNSWTSAAHLLRGLRRLGQESMASDFSNPFLLGPESAALLLLMLERDGLLIREMVREMNSREVVRRDEVSESLPRIAMVALEAASSADYPRESLIATRKLVDRLAAVDDRGRPNSPGVREHRTSPRLEWLTDLGFLSKVGIPKNSFEYRVTSSSSVFLSCLDEAVETGGDLWLRAAVSAWRCNNSWDRMRAAVAVADINRAVGVAYRVLRRPIGPSPLRDVCFVACLVLGDLDPLAAIGEVMAVIREVPGASLSGGRMSRSPENVYMTDESLRYLGVR